MRPAKGIVLMCAPGFGAKDAAKRSEAPNVQYGDRIVEVLHDGFDRARRGGLFSDVVDGEDQKKVALFLESINREGAAFGWEMHIDGNPVVFAGFASTGPWIVVGSQEPALMERLHQELIAINSEMTNALRSTHKQRAIDERRPEVVLDDFARLNNELSALHRDYAKRVRDLERMNREYERCEKEMAELNKRRQEFLEHLVHDLRNPLTSVNGGVALALAGVLGPIDEGAREALVLAKEGCDRLMAMIDSILDLGKAEAGQLQLTRTVLRVEDMVEGVLRELRNRATERGVTLCTAIEKDMYVLGDRSIVHRVLANYVVNALKFSPRGTTINVVARLEGNCVRVSVVDRGPGVPADKRNRLFTRYGQVERRDSSTGLGLVFCKEMVEAMRGTVGVDTSEGNGATFWFELERAMNPERDG